MLRRLAVAASAILVALSSQPAFGATVLYHASSTAFEDGRPGYDPEGTWSVCDDTFHCVGGARIGLGCGEDTDCPGLPDGELEWGPDKIHVVAHGYAVNGQYHFDTNTYDKIVLRILPNTIVKFANACTLDGSGGIVSCTPTTIGQSEFGVQKDSNIRIDRATLTDIRDDTIGGDTNNDGSSTTPVPAYGILFSGNGEDLLIGTKVRYARELGKIGSMAIRFNSFTKLGGLSAGFGAGTGLQQPAVRGSVPRIEVNDFEILSTAGPGSVDLRGTSPVVWKNLFTGSGTALRIGPTWEDPFYYKHPTPESGTTRITHNRIKTKNGILTDAPSNGTARTLEQVGFRATIANNILEGPGGDDGIGLRVLVLGDMQVRFNSVENYPVPLVLSFDGAPYPPTAATVARMGLELTDNSFSLTGVKSVIQQNLDVYWNTQGAFINAEHNWWGHYSGPLDASNADSLVNPKGLGLSVTNGIDYKPFLGTDLTGVVDSIAIDAYSVPAPIETDDTSTEIRVDVDYELKTADTGTVVVYVRNALGELLNSPGTTKQVQKNATTTEVGPIPITSISPYVTTLSVEAVLMPDATDAEELRSNVVPLPILLPSRSFRLSCVSDAAIVGECPGVELLPDSPALVRLRFTYTLGGSNVHATVEMDVRAKETGEILQTLPSRQFVAPPGFEFFHLEDVPTTFLQLPPGSPEREFVIRYRAVDDDGAEIGRGVRNIPILDRLNSLLLTSVSFLDESVTERGRPAQMFVGEKPYFKLHATARIGTKNVSDWYIRTNNVRALGAQGQTLQAYTLVPPTIGEILTTGFHQRSSTLIATMPIEVPSGSQALVFDVDLVDPSPQERVISREGVRIPIQGAASIVHKEIPAGSSVASFSPVPAKLEVEANKEEQIIAMAIVLGPLIDAAPMDDFDQPNFRVAARTTAEQTLIPLNRHFSIYGDTSGSGLSATLTLEYDPEEDFPDEPSFDPDSLVIAALNPLSGKLEALPSQHSKSKHSVSAQFDGFYGLWTIASDATAPAAACADPTADGNTTAADALFALRASVGSSVCAPCICDVNKNGSVTTTDALLILKYAVGQTSAPSCVACGQ